MHNSDGISPIGETTIDNADLDRQKGTEARTGVRISFLIILFFLTFFFLSFNPNSDFSQFASAGAHQ